MKNLPEGTIFSLSENRIITLYDSNKEIVGEIDFGGDSSTFEGNMDASADKLFSFLKSIIIPFFKDPRR